MKLPSVHVARPASVIAPNISSHDYLYFYGWQANTNQLKCHGCGLKRYPGVIHEVENQSSIVLI